MTTVLNDLPLATGQTAALEHTIRQNRVSLKSRVAIRPVAGNEGTLRKTTVMYSKITRGIRVTARSIFLAHQSSPANSHFVWAYQIRIDNESNETVKLLSRYWQITDALGQVQEVRGSGVVGEQPVILPSSAYEYTSGSPLAAPSGIMVGNYQMATAAGEQFQVDIPAFSLDSPYQPVRLN
ncbi:MAG: Co2+/Mg2+ efflux protein ApaG [Rhodospirillaceae bacterium]